MNSERFDYEFGDFRLDEGQRILWRAGQEFVLPPKTFDTLFLLVRNSGRILTKDELLKELWPDTFVTEATLARNISDLRKLLGDTPDTASYIETIPKRGYRFVAAVRRTPPAPPPERSSDPPPRRRRMALIVGTAAAALALASAALIWPLASMPTDAGADPVDIRLRRLTTIGTVGTATLSPDGRLFAYTTRDADGRDTVWLGETATGAVRELRGPATLSYRSLAISADNSTLYFVAASSVLPQGDLFRVPLAGGTAEAVARDVGEAIAFSPDGTELAFMRADARRATTALVTAHADGSGERELYVRPAARPLSTASAWAPDGQAIAVAASDEAGTGVELNVVRVADSRVTRLTAPRWGAVNGIAWTGSRVVISAKDKGAQEDAAQVWSVSYPDGAARRLTTDLSAYALLAAARGSWLLRQHQTMSNVWRAEAGDLSSARQITFSSFGRSEGAAGLEWTPDGGLLYTALAGNRQTLWRMNADGRGARELTSGPADTRVSATADGRHIVFQSNRSGGQEVWRARLDGSLPRQLTHGGENTQPVVSPDGRWVVFRTGAGALARIPLDGGEPVPVTDAAAVWPAISPDSRWIACGFAPAGSAPAKLAILPIGGGRPAAVFDIPRLANFRYGIRWTPDGKGIAYRDWSNGLWLQAVAGGPPSRIRGLPEEKIYSYGWSLDGRQFAFVRASEVRDLVLLTTARP